jgi:hypothetical protein
VYYGVKIDRVKPPGNRQTMSGIYLYRKRA